MNGPPQGGPPQGVLAALAQAMAQKGGPPKKKKPMVPVQGPPPGAQGPPMAMVPPR